MCALVEDVNYNRAFIYSIFASEQHRAHLLLRITLMYCTFPHISVPEKFPRCCLPPLPLSFLHTSVTPYTWAKVSSGKLARKLARPQAHKMCRSAKSACLEYAIAGSRHKEGHNIYPPVNELAARQSLAIHSIVKTSEKQLLHESLHINLTVGPGLSKLCPTWGILQSNRTNFPLRNLLASHYCDRKAFIRDQALCISDVTDSEIGGTYRRRVWGFILYMIIRELWKNIHISEVSREAFYHTRLARSVYTL